MFDNQLSLLSCGEPGFPDPAMPPPRTDLGRGAWIDHEPHWLPGANDWLDVVQEAASWRSDSRPMYDRIVEVPRLIWSTKRGNLQSTELAKLADLVGEIYKRRITSVSANWYRDGRDSVAIHRDKMENQGDAGFNQTGFNQTVVAIVSLGDRRPFLLKPDGGGPSHRFMLGHGDLFTMGGTTQTFFQHAVPKVAHAGSRISVMFRAT